MTDREPEAGDAPATDDGDVEELLDELEDLEESADSHEERQAVRQAIDRLARLTGRRIFGLDDLAQQVVGGFVLSAPFVVTEEVWSLAAAMSWLQWSVTVFMVVAIGYGTLYKADDDRDAGREESIWGLPLRFVSLVLISYLSVSILAFVFSAPTTFEATTATTVRAISIGAVFSVVGAATADSLF